MLIQDRVKLIIKANSLTASQFADQIGIKRSNLSHVLSGRNKPSLDFLSKIIANFPSVNASWLVTGETREEVAQQEVEEVKVGNKQAAGVDSKEIVRIIHYFADGTFLEYTPSDQ